MNKQMDKQLVTTTCMQVNKQGINERMRMHTSEPRRKMHVLEE